jgi:hypothetical protein
VCLLDDLQFPAPAEEFLGILAHRFQHQQALLAVSLGSVQ